MTRKLNKLALYVGMALATTMAVSSCGDGHTAKSHAQAFLEGQMTQADVDYITWSKLDSTKHLTDSALQAMRATAEKSKLVKPGTTYQQPTAKLNLISLRYAVDKDTLMATFYLDDKLTGIVGVKANPVVKP